MAGETITAQTLDEGLEQIRQIYSSKSNDFRIITQEEYENIQKSEREDSDNHLNLKRLGTDTEVVDLAYYKYLPDHQTAYRVVLIHSDGVSKLTDYFIA